MKLCSALLSLLAFLVGPPAAASRVIDRTAVTVNNEAILESDIDRFLKKARSKSFQELFGGIDDKVLSDRQKVLSLLVEEKIIDQQVKKLELQATPQEVDAKVREITKRNGITPAQLDTRLKQLGTPMSDYKDGIKRQLERRALLDREIKPTLEVSDEQLRHFYQRASKNDKADKQYKIAHILIDGRPKGGVTAEARAKQVHSEVAGKPGDFEKFAKDFSDDSSTAATGGVLGTYPVSQLAREFREIVPKTPEGKVTPVIKTRAGYHIVKVLEVNNGDFGSLTREQKDQLRQQLAIQETERKMGMWLERKKHEAHIRIVAESGK